jgi:4'-phosphopantetheinyl transferase
MKPLTDLDETWAAPPAELTLARHEVHVWRAFLDQPASSEQRLARTLTADEQLRAGRFRFERDRLHFSVGRGVLRAILGRYVGLEPGQIRFQYSPHGKPALLETLGGDRVYFNLAHSHGLAVYAFTREWEIGIDVEYIRLMPDAEQIAARFFSSRESAQLRALPPEQQQAAFFNCWTRKEAYLKALGHGLARPLNEFDVSLVPGEPARLLHIGGHPEEASRWFMQELKPAGGYIAALALPLVMGETWRLKQWQWV